ncbi:MAG: metalloregulator ArsR/SmtB family transcription factor [Candidatus Hydrogenedens sp.]|nr:metalloregulator ArsR/SmtB family transcription factor [Candidatus Hydrogenedens sp.]
MKTLSQLVSMEQLEEAGQCLKTLAHPHRLRMVEMLLESEYTVGELAEACGIQSHQASEHLGKMRDRGLLAAERRGQCTYYKIAEPALASIFSCIRKRFGAE